MVDLGPLDRLVSFERAGAAVDDGHTEKEGAFAPLANGADIPATFKRAPGAERFAAAQVGAVMPVTVVIRWSEDVESLDAKDIFTDEEGHPFDIKSVIELGRRDGLEILAVRKAD